MAGRFGLIWVHSEAGIAVWTGLPGGGKSFQAAQLQVAWLETGSPVLSNLKITALPNYLLKPKWGEYVLADDEDFKACDPVLDDEGNQRYERYKNEKGKEELKPVMQLRLFRKLQKLQARHPGKHVLILIDEAHNYYPSRNWSTNPDAVRAFLTQHRHLNCSVVAVTQNHSMLENTFLRLAQEFRHHKNLVKDSMLEIVLWWFGDNFHLAYSCANSGGKPFTQEKYARTWFRIKKAKAALYNTTQMHATDLRGAARQVKGRSLRIVFLCLFLLFIFGCFRVLGMVFGKSDPVEEVVQVKAQVADFSRVVLTGFQTAGDTLVLMVQDNEVGERIVYEPYSDKRMWELVDLVGEEINVSKIKQKPFFEVVAKAAKEK